MRELGGGADRERALGIGDVDLEVDGPGRRVGRRRAAGDRCARSVRVGRERADRDRRAGRHDVEVDLRHLGGDAHGAAIDERDDGDPGAHERARDRPCAWRPRRRRARAARSRSPPACPLQLRLRSPGAGLLARALGGVCSISFGETKPPSSSSLRCAPPRARSPPARPRCARLHGDRLRRRRALRQSSVASTSPRLTTSPGPTSTVST